MVITYALATEGYIVINLNYNAATVLNRHYDMVYLMMTSAQTMQAVDKVDLTKTEKREYSTTEVATQM